MLILFSEKESEVLLAVELEHVQREALSADARIFFLANEQLPRTILASGRLISRLDAKHCVRRLHRI
jgi:hypothetical protein